MPNVRKFAALFALAFVPSLVAGCASQITVSRLAPAEVNLKGIKRIAVTSLTGPDGDTFSAMITERLVESRRFEVLERSQMDRIASEHHNLFDAAFQQGQGLELGKLLPAAALVMGNVEESKKSENVSQASDTCYRDERVGNKKVSVKYSCTLYTRTAAARFVASVRIIDTNTGRILATRRLAGSRNRETTQTDGDPETIDGVAMLEECRGEVADAFLRMVAPYTVQERVELEEDGALPELKQGNEYLKRGDPASATDFFAKAAARADATPSLGAKTRGRAHYSLGLARALAGDYDTGLTELRVASQLSPIKEWLDLEMRVRRWKQDAEKVNEQAREAAP